jgi:beta-lactam-binding protein with PASTA domain
VVGQSATAAANALQQAGFTSVVCQSADEQELPIASSLQVTAQSVTSGKSVATDTTIVLTCESVNGRG